MAAFMTVFRKRSNLTVVLGTHDLSNINERTMRYNVKKCKHTDYKKPLNGNDIMMLKVRTNFFYF
jgi:hypothetical protein